MGKSKGTDSEYLRENTGMNLAPITRERVDQVIMNLSEDSWREADAFGLTSWHLRNWFIDRIEAPFSAAFLNNDGEPMALCILEPLGNLRWRSHFVATSEALNVRWLALTRFLKRFSDKIIEDTGGEIEILSASGNGRAATWFRTMGFTAMVPNGDIDRFVKRR
jgi:hypothetical protein